jgi:hypothetical protein
MATGVIRQSNRRFDDLFFSSMGVVILVSVFVGFAPNYYLGVLFRAPLPNLFVHIHGGVFSCWTFLPIAQTSLVAAGRVDVHRRLGLLEFGLACLVVILGVQVATDAQVRHAAHLSFKATPARVATRTSISSRCGKTPIPALPS